MSADQPVRPSLTSPGSSNLDSAGGRELYQIDCLLREIYKQEPDVSESALSAATIDPWLRAALPERFQIKGLLGFGTFGLVLLVHDQRLKRDVAVKVLRPEWMAYPSTRQRFLRESRAAARLSHTHIVRVLEADENDKIAWQVCDVISGATLAEHLRQAALPPSVAARLVAELAEAIDYAHENGIVHRDIKPDNILLSGQPGAELDHAHAHLGDFGLAKMLDEELDLSHSGALLGTPRYMAPERFTSRGQDFQPSADIYSLGVVLFECLTGQFPQNEGPAQLQPQKPGWNNPPSPREFVPQLSRDLDTICRKAMEPDPETRYATAGALARDLRSYLHGEPIAARPLALYEHTWRWARRHRWLVGLLLTIATSLILITIVSWRARRAAERQNVMLANVNATLATEQARTLEFAVLTEQLRQQALAEQRRYQQLAWNSGLREAFSCRESGQLGAARQRLDQLRASHPDATERLEWQLLDAQLTSEFRPLMQLDVVVEEVRLIDQSLLAAVAANGHLYVLDREDGRIWVDFDSGLETLNALAVHPVDSALLLVGGTPGDDNDFTRPFIFNWRTQEVVQQLGPFPTTIESIATSADGRYALCGARYENPRLFDLQTGSSRECLGERRHYWLGWLEGTGQFVFHSDHKTVSLVCPGEDEAEWRLDFSPLLEPGGFVRAVTTIPDTPLLGVALAASPEVLVVDSRNGWVVGSLGNLDNGDVFCLTTNAMGDKLAAGLSNGQAIVWDVEDLTAWSQFAQPQLMRLPRIEPGQHLFEVRRLDQEIEPIRPLARAELSSASLFSVAFAGQSLIGGTAHGELLCWTFAATTGSSVETSADSSQAELETWDISWSTHSGHLALNDRLGHVWRIPAEELERLSGQRPVASGYGRLSEIMLSPILPDFLLASARVEEDPAHSVVLSADGSVVAWPTSSLEMALNRGGQTEVFGRSFSVPAEKREMSVIGISPDSSQLAVMTEQKWFHLYDLVQPGRLIAQFELPGTASCVDWSSDGQCVVVAGLFGSLVECDCRTGTTRTVIQGLASADVVSYLSDDSQIVSAHNDGVVRFTDRRTGQTEALKVHSNTIRDMVLCPDQRIGISLDVAGQVALWMIPTRERLGTLCETGSSSEQHHHYFLGDRLWLAPDLRRMSLVHGSRATPTVRSWLLK